MIICNDKCQLYGKCEVSGLVEHCIFDNGISDKDDDDEFLDKIT